MRLSTDDLEKLHVAGAPSFANELVMGGAHLADRTSNRKLAAWRLEVARDWNPNYNRLFDLYTNTYLPGFFDQAVRAEPSSIDPDCPAATAHLRDLSRSGALTPFTRAFFDGSARAVRTLTHIVSGVRARALDPYRRRITSAIATASAEAGTRAVIGGIGDMLNSLHPWIRWDGRVLRLNTVFDAEESLDGRPLIFQPTVLATRIAYNPLDDSVTVSYPVDVGRVTRDRELDAPPAALVALLGSTRAAALVAVVMTPALTTGRLAVTLGVSAAAASRHASVLRESGLIATVRSGQRVHHAPTRLGTDLVHGHAPAERGTGGREAESPDH